MEKEISVVKRRDRGRETLNIEKIHEMVEYAVEGINGVSTSQVEMNSGLQFFDGISTDEIQQILVKSAADLISLEKPNYQYVAARLLLYSLRKQVFNRLWDHPHFYTHIQKCVEKGLYDKEILDNYNEDEFNMMHSWLDHKRDYNFTYAGLRQVIDKDFNIVIWSDEVKEKDINELIMNGLSQDELIKIIEENTYSKLSALTKLTYWRKR